MHDHAPAKNVSRKLLIASMATIAFVVVELGIGIVANSLALIGDAFHNFTDTLALLLALFAVRMERKPPNPVKSYGYHRTGVVTAFVNAGTLVAFTVFIFAEAVERLRVPERVDPRWMLITASVAIALNGGITLALRRDRESDLNIRSAVLHMMGDAVSSVGIIVAAVLIRETGMQFWDPAISMIIGLMILWSSWGVLKEALNLLLEGTPEGIDPEAVTRSLAAIDGIHGVHHLHIWALGPSRPALSCHLLVGDVPVKTTGRLLDCVNSMLEHEYRIAHTTIQFEFTSCEVDDPYCVPSDVSEHAQ
ncbi:MAG TPA: cation diffusion facilitator family transporter [Thermoanaerobaculia bacterium]|jgi:cobalt-zinc-cadmium efflux system protein|nr:cation diffusion facilitator family transporter [Thermoanaerobaculia bacterium]